MVLLPEVPSRISLCADALCETTPQTTIAAKTLVIAWRHNHGLIIDFTLK